MKWRPEYDAVSQPGMVGPNMGLGDEPIRLPTWFVTHVAVHKLEDLDPRQIARLLKGFCDTQYQGNT